MPSPVLPYASGTSPSADNIDQLTDIVSGRLMGNLNGNGKTIDLLAGIEVGGITSKEVWIGQRSPLFGTTPSGSGSKINPFHCGSATQMAALISALPAASEIHLLDGEFSCHRFLFKEGTRLYAAQGDGSSILKFPDNYLTEGGTKYMVNVDGSAFDYNEIDGVHFDLNRDNQAPFAGGTGMLGAFFFVAKSALVRNCRVTGMWNGFPGTEAFPMAVQHHNATPGDEPDVISFEYCRNINPMGWCGAISAGTPLVSTVPGANPSARFIGKFRDCIVTDCDDGTAFGTGGCEDVEMVNCHLRNGARFTIADTNAFVRWRIHDCTGRGITNSACYLGGYPEYSSVDVKIHDSYFEMANVPNFGVICTANAPNTPTPRVEIYHNVLVQLGSEVNGMFNLSPGTTGLIHHNTLKAPGNVIVNDLSVCTGLKVWQNRNWSGNVIALGKPNDMAFPGLSVYASNAAAVAGGLTPGNLYRSGGDPDVVSIVH